MSKQIYIDSNGNEIQVSGTVNTADMMPMSGNDSTKVSEAIGNLSTLTTTDKSSLVGAVNEVVSTKLAKSLIKTKEVNGTTNASGAIELGLNYTSSVLLSTILASSDASMYCVPMAYSTSPNKIYVYVKRYDNTSAANTNVKVICSYIDMTPNWVT